MSADRNCDTDRVGLIDAEASEKAAYTCGWNDGVAQAPFPAVYEASGPGWQFAYEGGRLFAVNVVAAGLAVPTGFHWGDPVKLRQVDFLAVKSAKLIGDPVPPDMAP